MLVRGAHNRAHVALAATQGREHLAQGARHNFAQHSEAVWNRVRQRPGSSTVRSLAVRMAEKRTERAIYREGKVPETLADTTQWLQSLSPPTAPGVLLWNALKDASPESIVPYAAVAVAGGTHMLAQIPADAGIYMGSLVVAALTCSTALGILNSASDEREDRRASAIGMVCPGAILTMLSHYSDPSTLRALLASPWFPILTALAVGMPFFFRCGRNLTDAIQDDSPLRLAAKARAQLPAIHAAAEAELENLIESDPATRRAFLTESVVPEFSAFAEARDTHLGEVRAALTQFKQQRELLTARQATIEAQLAPASAARLSAAERSGLERERVGIAVALIELQTLIDRTTERADVEVQRLERIRAVREQLVAYLAAQAAPTIPIAAAADGAVDLGALAGQRAYYAELAGTSFNAMAEQTSVLRALLAEVQALLGTDDIAVPQISAAAHTTFQDGVLAHVTASYRGTGTGLSAQADDFIAEPTELVEE